jgi:hypothetical protein
MDSDVGVICEVVKKIGPVDISGPIWQEGYPLFCMDARPFRATNFAAHELTSPETMALFGVEDCERAILRRPSATFLSREKATITLEFFEFLDIAKIPF